MTCVSLSESIMSNLVDPMFKDNLYINIVAHDRNLIVGYIKVRHLYRVLSPSAHVLLSFCVE